jgi:hypothetical protein
MGAAEAPRPGEVTLPLAEYLALVDQADAATRAKALRVASEPPARADVVAQRTTLRVDGGEATVLAELEVLVAGHPKQPVRLPFPGYAATVELLADGRPALGAAVTAAPGGAGGGVLFVAPAPGRYTVKVEGRAPLAADGGISRLSLPATAAPVAVDEVDLPADVAWQAPQSVVVDERVQGDRRLLRLAGKRDQARSLELRRHFTGAEADKLLARAVVLTLFELRPEGTRRHDVVLYDVDRGSLPSFAVELPPGLELGEVATDEGVAVPVVEGGRLTVHRKRQLVGLGYLVLTSTGPSAASQPLAPPRPAVEVRARYLAVAASVAAEARPLPAASWSQVDLDDLPPLLREALQAVDLVAAWREVGAGAEVGAQMGGHVGAVRLEVAELAVAARLGTLVRRRDTTTLLTVDGTVLHRDRFLLATAPGEAGALDVTLPTGAVLWSARVGEQPVRPLQRGEGRIAVPLGLDGGETVVEVVAVLERALPGGRSRLDLALPEVAAPVLDHRWRLLLPEAARYRYRGGDLRPAAMAAAPLRVATTEREKIPGARDPWQILQRAPRALTDRTNVGGNEGGQQSGFGPGGTASIFGVITDPQGAALPGVTVTLTGSTAPLVAVTDAHGVFRFLALPPGRYAAKAELEGFSTVEHPSLQVTANQRLAVEVALTAAVEDVITVTAESAMLDEHRFTTGATVTLGDSPAYYDFDAMEETRKRRREAAAGDSAQLYAAEVQNLQQGLVGGVKPLPVAIPEAGKLLLLTGVLPPSRVGVELEVKAKR